MNSYTVRFNFKVLSRLVSFIDLQCNHWFNPMHKQVTQSDFVYVLSKWGEKNKTTSDIVLYKEVLKWNVFIVLFFSLYKLQLYKYT